MSTLKKKGELVAAAEAALLRQVRAAGALSRVELARRLHLAPSTVGIYVERLLKERLLRESGKALRGAGRPPNLLELGPQGGAFIGVDFEARDIMAVSVDFAQNPLERARRRIGPTDSVGAILGKVERAISAVRPKRHGGLLAIGVGAPGVVDAARGMALHYEYINNWRNIALAERLGARFGVPVYVENNVRSMAYGEMWFGQGRGVRDFVCLGIRSGIAAGIVVDGRLVRGHAHFAGEIGRWLCPVAANTRKEAAKGPKPARELEQIASVRAILREAGRVRGPARTKRKTTEQATAIREVLQAADSGDPQLGAILAVAAEAIGWAAGQLTPCLNPRKIIIAGPLADAKNGFLTDVRKAAARAIAHCGVDAPEIVKSRLGEFSGALGAAALAVHRWQPAR